MKVKANAVQINYAVEGAGPWLVMSHSLACGISMWDEQVESLKSKYKVLCFDTRGHGASDAPAGAYSLDMLAEDLHGLLGALRVQSPHFVGLSMGGMIGMVYALKYPGVFKSLVLCDTSSRIPPEAKPVWDERIKTATEQGMEPLVEPTLKRWFTEPYLARRNSVVARVADLIRHTPPQGYTGCCHAISKLDVTARLAAIECPVQIIVGEKDVGTPVAMSETIHKAISGSELVVIPDASHLSNLEQPAAFNTALLRFLAGVS
ncbi:MAG TPA: 3-oxoadipate enol-lactonase [Burkholderiales bacterium]|nr:3-oxoadipate enol-lactonase [Burkholderiales bacterium]